MLCPTCFSQIKIEDKKCDICGGTLDDLSSANLFIPSKLDHCPSAFVIFLKKMLLPSCFSIFFALIGKIRNMLWLPLAFVAFAIIDSFLEIGHLHKKCFHGIPGGSSNGKCDLCKAGLLQRHKNLEEFQHLKAIHIECNQLRTSEIKKIRIDRNKKIENLQNLDPFDFERVIIEMYSKLGYKVEQTPLTNDHGMDGIAYKDGVKYLIECKRYARNNLVGRPELQKFFAAISVERAKGGFFVTTSRFTDTAFEFAKESFRVRKIYIELINGVKLVELMKTAYFDSESEKKKVQVMCKECGEIVLFDLNEIADEKLFCLNGHVVEKNICLHKGKIIDKESFEYQRMKQLLMKIRSEQSIQR